MESPAESGGIRQFCACELKALGHDKPRGVDVTVNISHNFTGDLALYLVAPDGTRVQLMPATS